MANKATKLKVGIIMFNSINEVCCPNQKHIKYFLWYDYFHDAKLLDVEFKKSVNRLTLKRQYKNDEDLYFLTFKMCEYFICEKSSPESEFINSAFKNSPILCKINEKTKKRHYHLRIQLDNGYMDIIFGKFDIRKSRGRIRIPEVEITDQNLDFLKRYHNGKLLSPSGNLDEKKIFTFLYGNDDFDTANALEYFGRRGIDVLEFARKFIGFDPAEFPMTINAALWILALQGGKEDLPVLQKMYSDVEYILPDKGACFEIAFLPKRRIMDTVEMIGFRETKIGNGGI
jgi:hypothetical protein